MQRTHGRWEREEKYKRDLNKLQSKIKRRKTRKTQSKTETMPREKKASATTATTKESASKERK